MRLLVILVLSWLCANVGAAEWWTDYGAQELLPSSTRPPQAGSALTLLAPINGCASGQIAVRGNAPITALQATCGDLAGPGGKLPPGTVRVRFLTNADLAPAAGGAAATGPLTTISDTFLPGPSPVAVAYLTAVIPPGTTPGDYIGTVVVSAGPESFTVPLTVRVADFVMPGRSDLDLWISLMQSPAQLALAYQVAPYSEAHWRAIEASTRLLGDLGNHIVYVPVLWHANCGSGPQLVVFTHSGETLQPDFSRLERYLRLVARECGPQRLLVLGVWGRWLAKGGDSLYLTEATADGSLKPLAWSADYAANETLWKQVYDGVAALAKQHLGVDQEHILLGLGDDLHPSAAVDAVWQRIAPRSPGWESWTHNYGGKGPRPALFEVVDTEAPPKVDELLAWPAAMAPVLDGANAKQPFYLSACRDVQSSASPAVLYYSLPDLATTPQKTGHCAGIARMGLDFWRKQILLVDGTTVTADGYGHDGSDNRTHPGRVIRNYRNAFTAQGPTGALPLIHFDALREGVQAAQARLSIVRAMAAKPDQAATLGAVLEQQWETGARFAVVAKGKRSALCDVALATIQAGWAPLFAAAGQAQRDLGVRERDEASATAEAVRRGH